MFQNTHFVMSIKAKFIREFFITQSAKNFFFTAVANDVIAQMGFLSEFLVTYMTAKKLFSSVQSGVPL